MFQTPTTIILGAGSSATLEYPTGPQLVYKIINTIRNESYFNARLYREEKFSASPLATELAVALEDHPPSSIDFFLTQISSNDKLLEEAKFFIAYEILKCEKQTHFRNRSWYHDLREAILEVESPEDLTKSLSNLKLITFNYDVSLEAILLSSLSKTPYFREEHGQLLADSIIHVYGQLGKFKWQGGTEYPREGYGFDDQGIRDTSMLVCAERWKTDIFVMGEKNVQDSQHLKKCVQWLESTHSLYILGYGFHPKNNRLLGIGNVFGNARRVFMSTLSVEDEVVESVKSDIMKGALIRGGGASNLAEKNIFMDPRNLTEIIKKSQFFLRS